MTKRFLQHGLVLLLLSGCGFPWSGEREQREQWLRGWLGGSAPAPPVASAAPTVHPEALKPLPTAPLPMHNGEQANAAGKITHQKKELLVLSVSDDAESISWGADAHYVYFSDGSNKGIRRASLQKPSGSEADQPWVPGYSLVELRGGEILGYHDKKKTFSLINVLTKQNQPIAYQPLGCTKSVQSATHLLCWRANQGAAGSLVLRDLRDTTEKPVIHALTSVDDLAVLGASFYAIGNGGIYEISATAMAKKLTPLGKGDWKLALFNNHLVYTSTATNGATTTLGRITGQTVVPNWRSLPYRTDDLASDGKALYLMNDKTITALHENGDQNVIQDRYDDELTPYPESLRLTPTHALWIREFHTFAPRPVYQIVAFAR